ncbi:MAG: galactosyltransferase-related protein, partial [Candidatus Binataceae bacterium]
AHARAHRRGRPAVAGGPILNVGSYEARPLPGWRNYSNAFLCTCNASLPRAAFEAVGGFDEGFDRYGWEDTELGLRLRRLGLRRTFAWDAYLWHVKLPAFESFDVLEGKTTERAQMAVRLLEKDASLRTCLATGAYPLNLARAALVSAPPLLALHRRIVAAPGAPPRLRAFSQRQLLDHAYTTTLRRAINRSRAGKAPPEEPPSRTFA